MSKKLTQELKTEFDLEVEKAELKLTGGDSNNNLPSDNESAHSLDIDFHKPDKKPTKKSKKSKDQKPTSSKLKRKLESDDDMSNDDERSNDDESDYEEPVPKKAKKSKKTSDPRIALPTKAKKIKAKDLASNDDPSSKVKTDIHQHKLVYNGETYYCTYLPKNFQVQLDGIVEMRKSRTAEVDRIGAGKQFDKNEKSDATKRYQILCAIILSSQSTDKQVDEAMKKLIAYGLNISNICKTSNEYIHKNLINNLSMNINKAKYLKEVAEICRDDYDGDIPRTKAELKALPGVGNKVANLAMYYCWGELCGVPIDTHCSRVMNKLGWTTQPAPGKKPVPDKQASEIESWLPKDLWNDINELLVGFGQERCSTSKPKCSECLINKSCPWYLSNW